MDTQAFLQSLNRQQDNRQQQTDESQYKDAMEKASQIMMAAFLSYKPETSVNNFPKSIKTPDVAEVTKAVKQLEKTLKPYEQDDSNVINAISELKEAITSLQLNPTYKPEITVTPAEVNVKAPVVKVDAPDLAPLTKAIEANKPEAVDFSDVIKQLKKVAEEVRNKPVPGTPTVPTDPLIDYVPSDVDDAGTIQYFGYIARSGSWYIRKYDTTTSPKTVRFTSGRGNYATAFTNRASLTYGYWGS